MKFSTLSQTANLRKVEAAKKIALFLLILLPSFFSASAQVPGMAKLSVLLLLNLNGGSHNTADGVVAVFAPGFSSSIGNEDSYKFTNLDENLAINCGGTLLSIEGRPAITSVDTLPLRMWQFRQNTYCLKLDGSSFPTGLTAIVIDKYLNQETPVDLAGSTVVAFNITSDSASFSRDRFMIVFKPASVLPVTLSNVNAYGKDKGVQITWTANAESNVLNYEIEKSANGQQFEKVASVPVKGGNAAFENYSWYDANSYLGTNFYRIKTIDKSGIAKYSAILRVNTGIDKGSLNVFPNPVTGNVIGLQLSNLAKGDYTVALYNAEGQMIYSKFIKHAGGSSGITIQVDRQLRRGTYTLRLSNNSMSINKSVMVQ